MYIKRGSAGPDVRQVQRKLGTLITGVYDTQLYRAIIAYQEQHNIKATGEVDSNTWEHMFPKPKPERKEFKGTVAYQQKKQYISEARTASLKKKPVNEVISKQETKTDETVTKINKDETD